jgi:hypothetical protein
MEAVRGTYYWIGGGLPSITFVLGRVSVGLFVELVGAAGADRGFWIGNGDSVGLFGNTR